LNYEALPDFENEKNLVQNSGYFEFSDKGLPVFLDLTFTDSARRSLARALRRIDSRKNFVRTKPGAIFHAIVAVILGLFAGLLAS